jgi:hypothetical protein
MPHHALDASDARGAPIAVRREDRLAFQHAPPDATIPHSSDAASYFFLT